MPSNLYKLASQHKDTQGRMDNPLIRQAKTERNNDMDNTMTREAVGKTTASRALSTQQAPAGASDPSAIALSRKLNVKKGLVLTARATSFAVGKSGAAVSRAGAAVQGGLKSGRGDMAAEATVETAVKNEAKRLGAAARRKAGKYAAKGSKAAVRAVGKLMAALGRALVKIISASAAPVVWIIVIVAVIGLAIGSAFGVLFDDGDPTTPTMGEMVEANEQLLQDEINRIYDSVPEEPDVVLMDFYTVSGGVAMPTAARLNNWQDIMAIWAVRTTMADQLDVVKLDEQKQFLFQTVFQDMTAVDYDVYTETHKQTVTDAEGNQREIEVTTTTLLYMITSRTRQEMYREYGMSDDVISMTEELNETPEFQEFAATAAQAFNPSPYPLTGGIRPGQVVKFTARKLPPSALANQVVSIASKYLGTSYDELDCSKLTQTVFAELGVNLPRIAAEQARYIISNDKAVLRSDLQVGDLIFYALKGDNGRYMHVSHVAIYAGDGMIIDASSINGYTIYRELDTFSERVTVLYGRP